MRRALIRLLLPVVLIILVLSLRAQSRQPGEQVFKVGVVQRTFAPPEPYDWRGAQTHALASTVWYPAESRAEEEAQWIGSPSAPFMSAGRAAPGANIAGAPVRFPLIVLSHGTGSSAPMMAWLGTVLAAHGYIVAAVNHPGNNGTESYQAQGFLLWWLRAKDLSVVVDRLMTDEEFGKRIDAKRIGAAGFSLGGYTMMEIAGAKTYPDLYDEFCNSPRADGMCVDPLEFPGLRMKRLDMLKSDSAFASETRHAADSYRDRRVRAVFAIAPALGRAIIADSLTKIDIPVEIVAGEADTVVPPGSSAKFLADRIPHAKVTLLPGVGHYTFLATCGETGRRARPELCTDGAGIDRDSVHARVAEMAVDFIAAYLH